MNCQEAQDWIRCHRLFADGLGESESAALADHLLSCAACTSAMDREEAFDAAIHSAMHEIPIPIDLQQKVYWEMRRAGRMRQRRLALYASLAAAAVLCITISIGWYLQRPYDLASLQDPTRLYSGKVIGKFDPPQQGRAHALDEWLQRQGIGTSRPGQLKLQYLTAGYIVEVGGRKVAMLELNTPGSASRVYLLQRKYFNEKQRQDLEQEWGIASKIIADSEESPSVGWMVIDQGSAQIFLDDSVPQNGT